jgi:ABC-type amino acid transport substrate-binding protein
MTTVGYGDKSPVTPMGRFIGLIWMFLAIILISSLTAGIASALTVQKLGNEVNSIRDLNKFTVVTVENSSSSELLDLYQVPHQKVGRVEEALDLLNSDEVDIVIYDRPILQYYLNNSDKYEDISISSKYLKTDYYSFIFPPDSKYDSIIDPIIVRKLKSPEWNFVLERLSP